MKTSTCSKAIVPVLRRAHAAFIVAVALLTIAWAATTGRLSHDTSPVAEVVQTQTVSETALG